MMFDKEKTFKDDYQKPDRTLFLFLFLFAFIIYM